MVLKIDAQRHYWPAQYQASIDITATLTNTITQSDLFMALSWPTCDKLFTFSWILVAALMYVGL